MAIALARVLKRLRADHDAETDAPMVEWDGARRTRSFRLVFAVTAVVAVVAAAVAAGVSLLDRSVYAVLEAADASTYRIADGNRVPLFVGDRIGAREVIRSDGAAGAVLALSDGSRVEMRSMSELAWDRVPDGLTVRLDEGSVIVSATKQPAGQVYVRTKDMTASVAGTIALVNAAEDGSRVAVIEGEVRVRERGTPPGVPGDNAMWKRACGPVSSWPPVRRSRGGR
jgi:ferric-dicitrate binding protein FerR (iron transport regulator)